MPERKRPEFEEYFMQIAMAVRLRANCVGNRVGAIAVISNRVISTGYNGTPQNMPNCLDGGCHRCSKRDQFPTGTGYDLCICVHAEQNVLISAARLGIGLDGSTIYTTMQPCFGCTKEMLQANIVGVFYIHDRIYTEQDRHAEYERIQAGFPEGIRRLDLEDPDADWAVSAKRS